MSQINDNAIREGEGIYAWLQRMSERLAIPAKPLSRKEFNKLWNTKRKREPFTIYMSQESRVVWDKAIEELIKKQNE